MIFMTCPAAPPRAGLLRKPFSAFSTGNMKRVLSKLLNKKIFEDYIC